MKPEPEITRRCKECADWTHTVCCFAFGKFWRERSRNGTGCAHPLDDVAEAWRKAGWKPGSKPKVKLTLPVEEKPMPKVVKKAETYRQTSLFSSPQQKPAETPPLSDDDY